MMMRPNILILILLFRSSDTTLIIKYNLLQGNESMASFGIPPQLSINRTKRQKIPPARESPSALDLTLFRFAKKPCPFGLATLFLAIHAQLV